MSGPGSDAAPTIRSAVILAAGEGRRLRPLTEDLPKVMLPLGGRPLLEHLILLCRDHGVTDVYVNLFHAARHITDHLGDGSAFGVAMHYLHIPGPRPLLIDVRHFAQDIAGPFFVLYGDVATTIDLTALAGFHAERRAAATLVVRPTDHPWDSDLVELAADGSVRSFVRKGRWDGRADLFGNAGCYVLERDLVLGTPYTAGTDFVDGLFEPGLQRARLAGYRTSAWMLDIGTPERYERAQREFPTVLAESRALSSNPPIRARSGVGSGRRWLLGRAHGPDGRVDGAGGWCDGLGSRGGGMRRGVGGMPPRAP